MYFFTSVLMQEMFAFQIGLERPLYNNFSTHCKQYNKLLSVDCWYIRMYSTGELHEL